MSKIINFPEIKSNTIELEEGLYPNGEVEDFCDKKITGEEFDKKKDFFSEENMKEAFGENYKLYNEIEIVDFDGSKKIVKIPGIINGGMGTNVSSASLVEAMNKLGFGGHLSSIGIGFYHYYESHEDLFKDDFTWEPGLKKIVQKDFDRLFKEELGLSDELIKKHFFECDELCDEKNPNIKGQGFNGEVGKSRVERMMDLIAIYRQTMDLKSKGNTVGINCMYKTSSYVASLKIATLCGIDYLTTAAGNPEINPKKILKGFADDLKKEGKTCSIPALGLLVSSNRIVNDFDYDYYTFEEGDLAGGHILRMGNKYKEIVKIKEKFKKAGKKMPPIYTAGGVSTNEEIKNVLEAGFDGVQIGTLPAVSEEACNGQGEVFKKRLIGGNHLGENTEVDSEFFKGVEEAKKGFENIIGNFNKELLGILNMSEEEQDKIKIDRIKDYLFRTIYGDFFDERVENLSEEEQNFYAEIMDYYNTKYNGNDDPNDEKTVVEISKFFRDLGNSMKFLNGFEKFREENDGKIPTTMVFDSTAGFPGRTKIIPNMYEVVAGNIEASGCVGCLIDCILAKRGNVRANRGSEFCIFDRLNYLNPDKNIAFTGRSTVPYAEIRPIKDIMAYLMGTYVDRKSQDYNLKMAA